MATTSLQMTAIAINVIRLFVRPVLVQTIIAHPAKLLNIWITLPKHVKPVLQVAPIAMHLPHA